MAGGKSYRWAAKNVAAGSSDAFISNKEVTELSWENFTYEGHTGAAHSWSALGQFFNKLNQGRDVLILTENGGQIVHTPRYSEKDNRQMRSAIVKMDADGNATTDLTTLYTGLQQDDARNFAMHSNEKDVRDALIRRLHLPNFDLKNFKYTADRQRIPTVEEKLSLELPHYGSKSGKRLFVQPNIFSKFSFTMPDTTAKKARQLTVVATDQAYTDTDSLTFDLPEGFALEHTPEPTTLNSPFGNYSMACRLDGKRLVYTRKLVLNNSEQPKESFNILLDFMRNIEKADKMKLVLVAK